METPRADVIFRFEGFEADTAAGELRRAGVRIKVQEQPWRVLLILLERAGQVVTRERTTRTSLDLRHVRRFRSRPEHRHQQDPRCARRRPLEPYIRADRSPTPWISIHRAGGTDRSCSPCVRPQAPSRRAWTMATGLAAALAALLIVVLIGYAAREIISSRTALHRIAVLPLRNESTEPESGRLQRWADGGTHSGFVNRRWPRGEVADIVVPVE